MRLLKITGLAAGLVGAAAIAAYATGFLGLISAGYPRALWPALGSFETVAGRNTLLQTRPSLAKLDSRGEDLFKQSESRAVLAAHNGVLDLEVYGDGIGPTTRMNSYSLVKSLVGALVLKAVSEGRISEIDEPIGTYLPTLSTREVRGRSIRSFLEMRSGLDFEEHGADKLDHASTYNPFGNLTRLHKNGIRGVADGLELASGNKDAFVYQNVNTAVLGLMLSEIYDQPLPELLSEKIWRPAGAADAFWMRHVDADEATAYCCLYATARDWVHVGRFLMKNGEPGDPFLPRELWESFFGFGVSPSRRSDDHYGLHVRHNVLDRPGETLQGGFSYMLGQGGQVVYLMPEQDLVVVRFGEGFSLLHSTLYSAWNSIN
ncbi:serine hydrolase [Rhodobacterales bacterium]|nr:serine hydrolase [Rhodobacterales bacterium]